MKRIPEWNINLSTGYPSIDYMHQMLLVLARKTIQIYDEAGLKGHDFHDVLNRLATTADELFQLRRLCSQHGKTHRYLSIGMNTISFESKSPSFLSWHP